MSLFWLIPVSSLTITGLLVLLFKKSYDKNAHSVERI